MSDNKIEFIRVCNNCKTIKPNQIPISSTTSNSETCLKCKSNDIIWIKKEK
jgi:hypothetical protein